ncbi:MAG: hypothetical protein Kow00121_55200 [Elainellaceae cyanobacterium]
MKVLKMVRFRSILAVFLAAITAFLLVSVNPAEAAKITKPPVYTPAQAELIQSYTAELDEMQSRMLELPTLIQQGDWTNVKNLIHGPLGDLRITMFRLARTLDAKSQKAAIQASREVFKHIVAIDEAADSQDTAKAFRNYNEALNDLNAFFNLVPA